MSERVAPPRPDGCDVFHDDRDGAVVFCDPERPDECWLACDPDVPVVVRP